MGDATEMTFAEALAGRKRRVLAIAVGSLGVVETSSLDLVVGVPLLVLAFLLFK